MSKSKLDSYKENFSQLIDAIADMHNAHCNFLKKTSDSRRNDLRRETIKVKHMVGAILLDIGQVYNEELASRRAAWGDTHKKRHARAKILAIDQPNGENNVNKDI